MTFYPLLHILFFIAAFFAPKDAAGIKLIGPGYTMHWSYGENGWSEGNKIWSIKGNSTVVREGGRPDEVIDISLFVKASLTRDWQKEKKVMLSSMESLEKTDDGFVFRLNIGDAGEKAYRIIYEKGTDKVAPSGGSKPSN